MIANSYIVLFLSQVLFEDFKYSYTLYHVGRYSFPHFASEETEVQRN